MPDWTAKDIQAPYSIAYGGLPGDIGGLDEAMRQYASAGVNVALDFPWWERPEEWKQAASQAAQQYEVGIMPWGFFDPSQRESMIGDWASDPSIFGWYMWDEPGRDEDYPLSLRQEVAEQMRGYTGGEGKLMSIWDDPVWGTNIGEGLADIMGYEVAYPFGTDPGITDPLAWTTARADIYGYGGGPIQKAQESGMDVLPVLQAWPANLPAGEYPDIVGQYGAYQEAWPFDPGAIYYDPVGAIGPEGGITDYIRELYEQMGGTLWTPPDGGIPIDPGDTGIPLPEPLPGPYDIPPTDYTGGDGTMNGTNLWTDPYNFFIPTPTQSTYPPWVEQYEGETFPWARSMYPEAIGPGPETGEHYIPSFPHYRQYPYTPPSPTGFQYGEYPTPESFYRPITTPTLEAYQAGGAGPYPETQAFVGPTQPEAIDYIGQMLRGEIEIPGEAEIWQEFLGRTGTSERLAQEELTKAAERGGRAESGLYPLEQQQIRTGTQRAREDFAGELAIRKAEMRQQAQQAAIPLSMAQTQYGAGEADRVQQARERLWGAETTDLFNEFTSKLQVATTDYDMKAAQNELLEGGRERAFQVAREEFQKAFEEGKESGLRDDEAQNLAWERGLNEWQQIYQSIVMAATQEYDWVRQRREWSEMYKQIKFGAQQAAPSTLDYLGQALTAFLGAPRGT